MKNRIVCDRCGLEMGEKIEMHIRVIAIDEEKADVLETYFECPMCGKEYTVLVTDRKQRIMIQKRVKIQNEIQRAKKRRDIQGLKKYLKKYDKIKEEIIDREEVLMQKYIKE